MTADFLAALIGANLAMAAAIAAVIVLRKPFRRLGGARLAYWLWLIPPLAALASLAPPPPAGHDPLIAAPIRPAAAAAVQVLDHFIAQTAPRSDPSTAVLVIWLAVAFSVMVLVLRRQRVVLRLLGPMKLQEPGLYRAAKRSVGPALVGLFRPRIILPADFEERFDPAERALILAHEGAHRQAGDLKVNALALALACLNWFNPAVLLAVRLIRHDQELAADEAVMSRFPHKRQTYAQALLKTQFHTSPLPLGCYWQPRSVNRLKERIVMLTHKSPGRVRRSLTAAGVTVLGLSASLAAWAASPQKIAPQIVPAVVQVADAGAQLISAAEQPSPSSPASPEKLAGLFEKGAFSFDSDGVTFDGINCVTRLQGTARVRQGNQALTASNIVAVNAKARGRCGDLATLDALGGASFEEPGLTARGDRVQYDLTAHLITVSGNVRLLKDGQLTTADRVEIDEKSRSVSVTGPISSQPASSPVEVAAGPALTNSTTVPVSPAPQRLMVITNPQWLTQPSADDVMKAFPDQALRTQVDGRVVLRCSVGQDGGLTGCAVASESPAGYDFGAGALTLAPKYSVKPTLASGASVAGAQINVPVAFTSK